MTYEETVDLRAAIYRLQQSNKAAFSRVVKLLRKAVPDFDGDVELTQLNEDLLWQLQEIVHKAQKRIRPLHRSIASQSPTLSQSTTETEGLSLLTSEEPESSSGILLERFPFPCSDDNLSSISDSEEE